ncbi:pentapeptide repeat-containing protein [Streptoalloteichus hindustanus]|nr:pentapeptide repeat-containing protein [Streptoalloteichus hindustanus]
MSDVSQPGVVGEGSLARSVVTRVNLGESRLGPLVLADVRTEDVDLSNAHLDFETIRRVEVIRSRAVGVRLRAGEVSDLSVEESRLDYASLHFERVRTLVVFRDCSLREATFTGDLSNVLFLDSDLTDAEFDARAARGLDLRTCRLDGVKGWRTLRGATVSADQAVSVATLLATEIGLTVD